MISQLGEEHILIHTRTTVMNSRCSGSKGSRDRGDGGFFAPTRRTSEREKVKGIRGKEKYTERGRERGGQKQGRKRSGDGEGDGGLNVVRREG